MLEGVPDSCFRFRWSTKSRALLMGYELLAGLQLLMYASPWCGLYKAGQNLQGAQACDWLMQHLFKPPQRCWAHPHRA